MALLLSSTVPFFVIFSTICNTKTEAGPATCDASDGCGYDDTYYQSTNWMGKIPDEKPLYSLSIPGTHNSMARHFQSEFDKPLTLCQSMTLRTQLVRGIRAFDIRNRHINNGFAIHHGIVYQHARFGSDVVQIMSTFLDENPSETIIMHHHKEHEPAENTRSYAETMESYMNSHSKLTTLTASQASSITLGQARGKILMDYDEKTNRQEKQNWWHVDSCSARDTKWNQISRLLDRARSNPDTSTLFINYVSCSGGADAYNPFSGCHPGLFPEDLAERLNDKLNYKLSLLINQNPPRIGIIFMDFPGPSLIVLIIKQNRFRCRKGLEVNLDSRNVVTSCGDPDVSDTSVTDIILCRNGKNVKIGYICDGDNDCGDCTDEDATSATGCRTRCTPGVFRPDGNTGDDSYCSWPWNGKCEWGEGDCDYDSGCMNGLSCGDNNCRDMTGTYRSQFDSTDDCCQ